MAALVGDYLLYLDNRCWWSAVVGLDFGLCKMEGRERHVASFFLFAEYQKVVLKVVDFMMQIDV